MNKVVVTSEEELKATEDKLMDEMAQFDEAIKADQLNVDRGAQEEEDGKDEQEEQEQLWTRLEDGDQRYSDSMENKAAPDDIARTESYTLGHLSQHQTIAFLKKDCNNIAGSNASICDLFVKDYAPKIIDATISPCAWLLVLFPHLLVLTSYGFLLNWGSIVMVPPHNSSAGNPEKSNHFSDSISLYLLFLYRLYWVSDSYKYLSNTTTLLSTILAILTFASVESAITRQFDVPSPVIAGTDAECVHCTYLVSLGQKYIKAGHSQPEILALLAKDCLGLEEDVLRSICSSVVENSAPHIVQSLINKKNPTSLCVNLDFAMSFLGLFANSTQI
eukprot:gene18033-21526_t